MTMTPSEWEQEVRACGSLRPYPAYKDSSVPWLGQVPEHWCINPAFAEYAPKQVKNTGLAETTVLSLSYGRIVVKPPDKLHGLVPESFETYQIIDPGDIIIRPTDLQNDRVSLRVGIARNRGIITSAYLCLRVRGHLSDEYGYLLLNAYDLAKVLYGYGSGLRQNLDYADIKRLPVLVPPPEEQTAIVRYLDHIDRRIRRYIRAKQRLIALLNEQRQAIIHRAVTRGLDPNVRLKPSGVEWLGKVPEHWEVKRLKFVVRITSGQVDPEEEAHADSVLIAPNHIQSATGRILKEETARAQGAQSGKYLVQEGQVIYSKIRPNLRKVAIAPRDCLCSADMYAMTPNPSQLRTGFALLLLLSEPVTRYAVDCSMRVAMPKINRNALGDCWLWYPPLHEQDAILEHLSTALAPLERTIDSAQREISLMREYRTRLISDVVTGKLDVRGVRLPDDGDEEDLPEWDEAEAEDLPDAEEDAGDEE